jgi:hypothetical protein
VVLPKEALNHLRVDEGDPVCLTEGADGSVCLTGTQPEVVQQTE